MNQTTENLIAATKWQLALENWQNALWQAQLREYPDSRRVAMGEVVTEWCFVIGVPQQHNALSVAFSQQYPGGVFYECGEGGKWRGYRYGLEGSQYLSGFMKEKK